MQWFREGLCIRPSSGSRKMQHYKRTVYSQGLWTCAEKKALSYIWKILSQRYGKAFQGAGFLEMPLDCKVSVTVGIAFVGFQRHFEKTDVYLKAHCEGLWHIHALSYMVQRVFCGRYFQTADRMGFCLSSMFNRYRKNHRMHSVYAAGVVCAVFFNSIMICVFFPFRHTVFLFFFFLQKFKNLHKLHQMLKTPSPQWFSSSSSCTKTTPETTSTTPEKNIIGRRTANCADLVSVSRRKKGQEVCSWCRKRCSFRCSGWWIKKVHTMNETRSHHAFTMPVKQTIESRSYRNNNTFGVWNGAESHAR